MDEKKKQRETASCLCSLLAKLSSPHRSSDICRNSAPIAPLRYSCTLGRFRKGLAFSPPWKGKKLCRLPRGFAPPWSIVLKHMTHDTGERKRETLLGAASVRNRPSSESTRFSLSLILFLYSRRLDIKLLVSHQPVHFSYPCISRILRSIELSNGLNKLASRHFAFFSISNLYKTKPKPKNYSHSK